MFADAIYPEQTCGHGHHDYGHGLRDFLRAMSGERGGRGRGAGDPEGHPHHGGGHRHRGGRAGFSGGPGPLGGGPFGGGPGGGMGPFWRARKARRGDIRTAALLLLAEEPRNGYQIMQEIEQRSDGAWRPSPGSVYPALQQLEDEGLIRASATDGRKHYELTDAGQAHVRERDESAPAPWEQMSGDLSGQARALGGLMREVGYAFGQVMRTGSPAQWERARAVLTTARRDLYQILADGNEGADNDA